MSGRGRGRGKAVAPPSVTGASFGNAPVIQSSSEPPPRFPTTTLPEAIDPSFTDFTMLNFSEELSYFMKTSPYFLTCRTSKETKIDRYSDKYVAHVEAQDRKGKVLAINTDLSFFPEELHGIYNPEKASKFSKTQTLRSVSFADTLAKLKDLEKNDELKDTEDDAKDEEDEGEDEVVYEEDELEDETDYNLSYFENGEDYGDYDDGDDGPIY